MLNCIITVYKLICFTPEILPSAGSRACKHGVGFRRDSAVDNVECDVKLVLHKAGAW